MATNPPITLGELTDVPAPGSGVKSAWCQEVTARIHHRFGTYAARTAAFTAPNPVAVNGTPSFITSADVNNGPEYFNGVAWRKPWNMPWGVVTSQSDQGQIATSGGTETLLNTVPAFATPGGRRYRIIYDFTGFGSIAGDNFRFTVRRGATVAGATIKVGPSFHQPAAGYYIAFTVIAYDINPPANAAMQYMVGCARMSGTGVFTQVTGGTYQNAMYVEDIGPAATIAPS